VDFDIKQIISRPKTVEIAHPNPIRTDKGEGWLAYSGYVTAIMKEWSS
jgi:hypothetical protein